METKAKAQTRSHLALAVLVAAALGPGPGRADAAACTGKGIELQVLGSGGPETRGRRASSSYLVWQDGVARVLVDSGGGSALHFGEAGARVSDLDVVLFTHLHADHTADFAALVKSSFFEDRSRPLPVIGPSGNLAFPSTVEFVRALFDAKRGAYRYLSGFLTGEDGSYRIQPRNVTLKPHELRRVLSADGLTVVGTPVTHGGVPAIAWRVEIGGSRLAFSGDTNGNDGNLEVLADRADVLVAHNAVPEGASGVERALHMPPSVIGRIAEKAHVEKLVLSHRMLRTLGREQETRAGIARSYEGPVVFADDLDCYSPK
ncbi:MAG: MBL fold metallo-hydrolase [Thermoanaerobaculia bacterium]